MIKQIIFYLRSIFSRNEKFEEKMKRIKKKDPFVYWSEEDWDKKQIKIPKRKK